MGTEYYFCNHQDTTFFGLGKGPWWKLQWQTNNKVDMLIRKPEAFVEWMKREWDTFDSSDEERKVAYFTLLATELEKFVKSTPSSFLRIGSDASDDRSYISFLKYKCVGSRYNLEDPIKNKQHIEDQNTFKTTIHLSETWLQRIKREDGWNLKNLEEHEHKS